jgi:O-antigen/teichoic acid export membrane protein
VDVLVYSYTWAPIIILGVLAGNEAVSIYNIGVRLALLTSFFGMAVNSIISPKLARAFIDKDITKIKSITGTSALINSIITSSYVIVIFSFPEVVEYVYGKAFAPSILVLKILAVCHMLSNFFGPVGMLLMMSHLEKTYSIILVTVFIFTLPITIFLTLKYGVEGAAIAAGSGLVLYNLISWILIRIKFKFFIIPSIK